MSSPVSVERASDFGASSKTFNNNNNNRTGGRLFHRDGPAIAKLRQPIIVRTPGTCSAAGGESSRTSSTAVGTGCVDIGGPAQLRLPWSHSVEQSVISTA